MKRVKMAASNNAQNTSPNILDVDVPRLENATFWCGAAGSCLTRPITFDLVPSYCPLHEGQYHPETERQSESQICFT